MTTPNTFLTLGEAAKETGKSKPTLSRAIKSGKLSCAEKENNSYRIDPAELFRVFPKRNTNETKQKGNMKQSVTPNVTHEIALLQKDLEHLKEKLSKTETMLKKEEENHAETKAEKSKLFDMVDNQTKLLSNMRDKAAEKPVESKKGFFATLLGK